LAQAILAQAVWLKFAGKRTTSKAERNMLPFLAALVHGAPSLFAVETLKLSPPMINPNRVAVFNNKLMVLDTGHSMLFDCNVTSCPPAGCPCKELVQRGLLLHPEGLFVSPNGTVLVADTGNCVVRRFDPRPDGAATFGKGEVILGVVERCERKCGNYAASDTRLTHPHGVSANSDLSSIWIANTGAACVLRLDRAGTSEATVRTLVSQFESHVVVPGVLRGRPVVYIGGLAGVLIGASDGTISTLISSQT